MSERLKDLQRQRALVQEQLAWIDREIARETAQGGTTAVPPASVVAPGVTVPAAASATLDAEADKIIDQYRDGARNVQGEVKRGCLLYFFAAFAVVGLLVAALYFARHH